MNTVFADDERQLEADVRRAWDAYRDQTSDLDGETYERIEAESWTVLQGELRRLARRRRLLDLAQ